MTPQTETMQTPSRESCHRLTVNLHHTVSWFNRVSAEWLAPYGLSLQQFNVLRILRGQHPEPAQAGLVQERMIDPMSNVSRLVEKLRGKGLVERCPCPTDRRAVHLYITDAGLALLDELDDAEAAWLDSFRTLTPSETDTLNRLLCKLRA